MKKLVFATVLMLALSACKKEAPTYELKGVVYEGNSAVPHIGGSVALRTKGVHDGVLQDYFTTTGTTSIATGGVYDFNFAISNLLAVQMLVTDTNYYTDTASVGPDALRNSNPYVQNMRLYPQSSVRVHLVRTGTYANVNFNWINADFNCDCCSNAVRNFPGLTTAEFTCPVYGNYWLKYFVLINATNGTTTLTDSIYCQPFQENLLELNL